MENRTDGLGGAKLDRLAVYRRTNAQIKTKALFGLLINNVRYLKAGYLKMINGFV